MISIRDEWTTQMKQTQRQVMKINRPTSGTTRDDKIFQEYQA
jgi:hypothetical protein